MKLKISLFNTGLILSNIKRFWWVSVLYFVGLTILLPLRMIQFSIAYNTNTSALSSISALVSLINMFGIFLWIALILIGIPMVIYSN